MGRSIFIPIFMFVTSFSYGQRIFFVTDSHDYSILINKNSIVKSKSLPTGYTDYFIVNSEDSVFQYLLSVNVVAIEGGNYETLQSEEYKQSYLEECGCQITAVTEEEYNNIRAVAFKIRTSLNGKEVLGYSINTVKKNNIYSVNFFTTADLLSSLEAEFNDIINSFVIN